MEFNFCTARKNFSGVIIDDGANIFSPINTWLTCIFLRLATAHDWPPTLVKMALWPSFRFPVDGGGFTASYYESVSYILQGELSALLMLTAWPCFQRSTRAATLPKTRFCLVNDSLLALMNSKIETNKSIGFGFTLSRIDFLPSIPVIMVRPGSNRQTDYSFAVVASARLRRQRFSTYNALSEEIPPLLTSSIKSAGPLFLPLNAETLSSRVY